MKTIDNSNLWCIIELSKKGDIKMYKVMNVKRVQDAVDALEISLNVKAIVDAEIVDSAINGNKEVFKYGGGWWSHHDDINADIYFAVDEPTKLRYGYGDCDEVIDGNVYIKEFRLNGINIFGR